MHKFRKLNIWFSAGIATSVLLLATAAASARTTEPLPERVQVSWAPTDTLAEVKDNQLHRGWMRPEEWQKILSTYLRKRADLKLPPGQKLDVTINDIKLAGDYEPWHGPDSQDIRYLKDIYPPRIDLHYKVSASDGSTLAEGDSKLRDLGYLQHTVTSIESDPLVYDKRLLDDWINRDLVRRNR